MIPVEILLILLFEVAYLVLIASLCLGIYAKTRSIYKLSRHKGIFHFRNIFLYFALAYFFRLVTILLLLLSPPPVERVLPLPHLLSALTVGYFSTMAILSVVMTAFIRKIRADNNLLNSLMHITAMLLTIFILLTHSADLLIILQTIILFLTVAMLVMESAKGSSKLSGQNKVTYVLLLIFWVINLFVTSRRTPIGFEILIYSVSVLIFLSIYLRVKKRLVDHGKKTKQA